MLEADAETNSLGYTTTLNGAVTVCPIASFTVNTYVCEPVLVGMIVVLLGDTVYGGVPPLIMRDAFIGTPTSVLALLLMMYTLNSGFRVTGY